MAQTLTAARSMAIAFLVAGAYFMESIDATMIVTAMPSMGRSFGVDAIDLGLGVSAYLITLAVLIPVSGWLADRLGARRIFALAVVVFTGASILCGLSQGLETFVLARVLQGAGGAMMTPVGRLVVLNNTPKNRLITAIAALTWPALVAPVLGPPLGGLITHHFGWRWIFWVNLPLGVLAFLAALLLIPADLEREAKPFDWPGFVLSALGLAALMAGSELLSMASIPWTRAGILLGGGALLLLWAVHHLRRAANPMIPLSALAVRSFRVTVFGGSLFRIYVSAAPFILPLMFQLGFGFTPVYSGFLLMAIFAGNVVMKPFTTPLMRRFGFRRILLAVGVANLVLVGACGLLSPSTPQLSILALLFAGGLTRSMQFTAINTLAFAEIPREQMSGANTLFSTIAQVSWGLGVVLASLSMRLAESFVRHLGGPQLAQIPGSSFRLAFVLLAVTALLSLWDSFTLPANAGEAVSQAC